MQEGKNGAFAKRGYKPASDYERFLRGIEGVLCKWKLSDKQPIPNELSKIHQSHPWNEVAHLQFAHHRFILTRYWTSGISSDCGTEKDSSMETVISKRTQKRGDSALNQLKEMPKAWLDMMDKSNLFRRDVTHRFHRSFGLKEFVVLTIHGSEDIPYDMENMLLSVLSFIALKCKFQLPLFVKCVSHYIGILECPGFRTTFRSWDRFEHNRYDRILKDLMTLFKLNLRWIPRDAFEGTPKVSMKFRYSINLYKSSDYPCKGLPSDSASTTDDKVENYEDGYPIIFYLNATWFDLLQSKVDKIEDKSCFNPLSASEWSAQVLVSKGFELPLGDCLKRFLSLCSSTQTESLLLSPQTFSILKYRRIYKQREEVNASLAMQGFPKVRKVTSKLTLKPEESLIPVESLDIILDFLFHDAKLQRSQCSSEANHSTSSTVEDDIEDKFYLSYKELSKFFKSAELFSLTSRLAICMCIVNKYHGGLGAVNQLWGEFVLEMKYCLENNCEIKGLEPVEPTLDYPELLKMLQVLNRCIKKKKARDASSPITDTSNNIKSNTDISSEEFIDICELPLGECIGRSEARAGTSRNGPSQKVQMLVDRLSAMETFYAANPGCVLGDFVRWCTTELVVDEGREEQGYPNQRIRISDDVSLVFHKSAQRRFPEDAAAAKVLLWLASVKPSDLVFRLMPILIYSTVNALLKRSVCWLHFQEHLIEIKDKLKKQWCNKAPECNSSDGIEKLEDHIHRLTFIEQKMLPDEYLFEKFRRADPSHTITDLDLQKFVSDLVQSREVPIQTSKGELPRCTALGKLIQKFLPSNSKQTSMEAKRETKKEYISILDRSKITGSCWRLRSKSRAWLTEMDAAFTIEHPPNPLDCYLLSTAVTAGRTPTPRQLEIMRMEKRDCGMFRDWPL